MIIVYTPAAGEPEQHDARTLLASEASIVARTIDLKWPQVKESLVDEDLDAMRGVVWILKKRHQPTLRFGDFDPGVDEMVTRYDKDEVETYVDNSFDLAATDAEMTPEVIAHALRKLPDAAAAPDHARAYIEKCQAAAEGKDPAPAEGTAESVPEPTTSVTSTSPTPEPSTSDSSLTS